jgi:Flp pilus assembly pilin Flp
MVRRTRKLRGVQAVTNLLARFWKSEDGFILTSELILIASILTLALAVGLTKLRSSIVHELSDCADAFSSVQQHWNDHDRNHGAWRDDQDDWNDDHGW